MVLKGSREWGGERRICQKTWREPLLHEYPRPPASLMGKRWWVLPSSLLKPGKKVFREGPW